MVQPVVDQFAGAVVVAKPSLAGTATGPEVLNVVALVPIVAL
jgi:hypothetical protein